MKLPILPMPLRHLVTTSAACAILTASALAQAPAAPAPAPGAAPTAPAPPAKPLSPMDKNFVKNAGKTLTYFVALAEAAKAKNDFSDPKMPLGKLRDTLANDGKKALAALSAIAQAHNEPLPTEVGGSDKLGIDRMEKLKDNKFAKEWTEELIKESKKLDRDYEQAGKTAQDPDLKVYASNYGPSVRNIFTSAEAAEKGLKAPKK